MRRIVQLELSAHCNRHCVYCGNPTMDRVKGHTSWAVVERTVEVLKMMGQTKDVGLNHYGESLLHPQFVNIARYFNINGITPFLYTNGDLLVNDDELITQLSTIEWSAFVISGHMPRERRLATALKCQNAGIPCQWQDDMPNRYLTDLGGQIKLLDPDSPVINFPDLRNPAKQCGFIFDDMGIVLWNGDLTVCCFDYEGHGKFGSIFDENVLDVHPKPFKTCDTCSGHPAHFKHFDPETMEDTLSTQLVKANPQG